MMATGFTTCEDIIFGDIEFVFLYSLVTFVRGVQQ